VKVTVVTSNPHKAEEVAEFFSGVADVEHIPLECPEIRHEDVREVAAAKAQYAFSVLQRPVVVDDTAFFIRALGGFPGTCAAYVFKTIGNEGILRLLEGNPERSAHFETAVAFADGREPLVFSGRMDGVIVNPRGSGGFGYDPIFEWKGKTLAELGLPEKSRVSHRALALASLRSYLGTCRS
jgi:XTP/dITP diphosphohydrolase